MEIMDHFAHELLSQPLPPGFDDPSLSCSAHNNYNNTAAYMDQLDNYFRAIGVLSPLPPPTTNAHVQLHPSLPSSPHAAAAATVATYDYDIDDDDDEIGASLRAMEADYSRHRPSPARCFAHPDLAAARAALVQWMHDLARHFGVSPDALHRAVSYTDRFLSLSAATASAVTGLNADDDYRLRLLGAAAVYVASKYEDSATASTTMNARDIAACCEFATAQDVLDAERALLAALGFRLGGPTARTFVDHYFTRRRHGHGKGQEDHEEEEEVRRGWAWAHAIADSSLLDRRCVCAGMLPSAVAAAAVLLAWMCVEPARAHDREQAARRWSGELEEVTGYRAIDVYDGVECLYNMLPGDHPGFHVSPLLFADPSELSRLCK